MLLSALAGIVTGLLMGLTGAGGSMLTLPAFIAIVGIAPHEAVGASLLSVGLTALTGLVPHLRAGRVRVNAALAMILSGAVAAILGGYTGRFVPETLLMTLYGFLMLFVAWRMALARPVRRRRAASFVRLLGIGSGVGFLSGFLGIGGGFLIVSALAGPGGLSVSQAVGTALVVVAVNAAMGVLGTVAHLGTLPWVAILPFVVGSLAGVQVGSRMATEWPAQRVRAAFAVVVVAVGVTVLAIYLPRVVHGGAHIVVRASAGPGIRAQSKGWHGCDAGFRQVPAVSRVMGAEPTLSAPP